MKQFIFKGLFFFLLFSMCLAAGEAAAAIAPDPEIQTELKALFVDPPQVRGYPYQQLLAGNLAPLAFGLSLVFVFFVLAALYESWVMPVMILMAIPLGLLGAVGGLLGRSLDLDVYGQIGLVMLIGLVAKNSILIVEFAKELREQGRTVLEAASEAARLRLRPILMTAFAFIVGLMPLVLAAGAGAGARRSLGTAVVSGLTVATVLIIMVPIFYYVLERAREGWSKTRQEVLAGKASREAPAASE